MDQVIPPAEKLVTVVLLKSMRKSKTSGCAQPDMPVVPMNVIREPLKVPVMSEIYPVPLPGEDVQGVGLVPRDVPGTRESVPLPDAAPVIVKS